MNYPIDNNPINNVNSNGENTPDANVNPPKKKSVLMLAVIITIIAVMLIVLGGVFAYRYYVNSQIPITNDQSNPNVQNSNTQTADWKTYKNDEHGFEIKYPEGKMLLLGIPKTVACFDGLGSSGECKMYTSELGSVSVGRDNEAFEPPYGINIVVVNHALTQNDIHKYDSMASIGNSINVTSKALIGGVNSYRYELISSTNYKIKGFIVPLDGNNYLEVYENSKYPRVEASEWDKIISTFKFTNPINVKSSITVTSPSGGETWQIGTTQIVQYSLSANWVDYAGTCVDAFLIDSSSNKTPLKLGKYINVGGHIFTLKLVSANLISPVDIGEAKVLPGTYKVEVDAHHCAESNQSFITSGTSANYFSIVNP